MRMVRRMILGLRAAWWTARRRAEPNVAKAARRGSIRAAWLEEAGLNRSLRLRFPRGDVLW